LNKDLEGTIPSLSTFQKLVVVADRPEIADLFQSKRWMLGISFQKLEAFVGKSADGLREAPIMGPESGRSKMLQSGLVLPAAKSRLASRTSSSSLPALASASSCSSHAAARNSANQSANCASYSGESCEMASSISFTFIDQSINRRL
jgi:hypothetical protein